MASNNKTKHILVSVLILSIFSIHTTHSQIITCPPTSSECHCPTASITGETCIFNCTAKDSCKSTTLYCRAGDPCEIRCEAKAACSDTLTIQASTATHVNLICNGEDTCKSSNTLLCGAGDCKISCEGKASCESFGFINTSIAHSFQCNGYCAFSNIPNIFTLSPTTAPSTDSTQKYSNNLDPIETVSTSTSPTMSPTISPTVSPSVKYVHVSDFDLYTIHGVHPLYYVIIILLLLIFIVCCILFCWVYLSHYHTQKLIHDEQRRLDSKSVNFNPSQLNIPTSFNDSFDTGCHKKNILTPTSTGNVPYIYRVQSDNSTPATATAVELQHSINNRKIASVAPAMTCVSNPESSTDSETSVSLNEGVRITPLPDINSTHREFNVYDLMIHRQTNNTTLPGKHSQTSHTRTSLPLTQRTLYKNYTPRPPTNIPPYIHYTHTVPPPPPLPESDSSLRFPAIHPNVRRSNIPPPPQINTCAHAHSDEECYNRYVEDSESLSDDTIMKQLHTITFDGESDKDMDSMRAVRHPTLSTEPYGRKTPSISPSPLISIQIKTRDGIHVHAMSDINLKKDNMQQTMQHIEEEIIQIREQFKCNPPQVGIKKQGNNGVGDEHHIALEVAEDHSKSLKSYSLEHTPAPKEYMKEFRFEDSMVVNEEEEPDRVSYAIRLVGKEEPTYSDFKSHSQTRSTVVEDTYYLND